MGLSVLDAGVVIGFLDGDDSHHHGAVGALRSARDRSDRLVLPASALAETLVGPARRGGEAVAAVRALIERLPVQVEPLDAATAEAAAGLRARHSSLKLPDALVIATASRLDADHLITTDRGWPTRAKLGMRASITTIR